MADPHRAGAETSYWPGDVNFRACDAIAINKANTAPKVRNYSELLEGTAEIDQVYRIEPSHQNCDEIADAGQ